MGYARAGRLIDIMEEMGIISGYDGSKARAVLIDEAGLPAALARVTGEVVDDPPADDEPARARRRRRSRLRRPGRRPPPTDPSASQRVCLPRRITRL